MTILASDIKLLKSERMSDAADGGGRMTSTALLDGVAGELFEKVSRLDAVYGRVNMRKIYAAVQSTLAEIYGGAHAIISEPPTNERISCLLFTTGSHFDTRAQAKDRVESYVVAGPLSRMRLYSTQIQGQRAILVYQRVEEVLPDVGDTLCLSVEAAGYTAVQQYVKIDDVEHEVRTFTDAGGEFDRRVIRLKLTSPLAQTFVGAEPVRVSADPSPTKVRETQVADTTKYYGIKKIVGGAQAGDLDLQLDSIYAPIVPSTQRETAISLASMAGAIQMVATGVEQTVTNFYVTLGGSSSKTYLPSGVLPGSLKIPAIAAFKDAGDGSWSGTNISGTIDYDTGEVAKTAGSASYEANTSVTWVPAREVATQAHSVAVDVTVGTRGLVYTQQLDPMPGAGSLTVDFRAGNRWYRLRDDGSGKLVGAAPAEGSGQVSYTSGAAMVTLGALPDVDSAVIWTWASPLHFTQRAGAAADNPGKGLELHLQLPNAPVRVDSVSIAYTALGSYALADNTQGVFAHVGANNPGVTASLDYATGELVMRFASAASTSSPATSSIVTVTYEQEQAAPGEQMVVTDTIAVTTPAAFNCGHTGITPKSFRLQRPMFAWGGFVELVDNGSGGLVTLFAKFGDVIVSAGQAAGTINYGSGAVTLTAISASSLRYEPTIPAILGVPQPGQWVSDVQSLPPVIADYTFTYKGAAVSYVARTYEVTISDVGYKYDLTTTVGEQVVPGSVWLNLSGSSNAWSAANSFTDRGNGLLYSSIAWTGAATVAGEIDYTTGIATIRQLTARGTNQDVHPVRACLTARGEFSVVTADFRTPGSPIRPASFYVQASATDGTLCTGAADQNGVITGSHVRGSVKALTGVAHVEFGDVVGGAWVPRAVFPNTIKFSAVALSNLPLDPVILGLDPVRLPSDGRVPIVRGGDVAVIHHTGSVSIPSPTPGAAIAAGRGDLALVEMRDAQGQLVPSSKYSVDLATGIGAFADPLDLTGHPAPLVLRHRIEEMAQVSDAQINGQVSIAAPLLRDYPAGAFLSTALLAGDMSARAEGLFDQQTWTNVWSDTLIGSSAVAELNTLQYPVQVSNEGTIKERWRLHVKSLSPLTIEVYGESLGLVGTYAASGTIAPVNALTGKIFWAIQPGAWGAGNGAWAVGNNVRFNTVSAAYPINVLRTILAGAALAGDAVRIESRGDVD